MYVRKATVIIKKPNGNNLTNKNKVRAMFYQGNLIIFVNVEIFYQNKQYVNNTFTMAS